MSEFLSQEEVDALIRGTSSPDEPKIGAPVISEDGVQPYNLATQERIVRGRLPTLEIINERFARTLRVGLFNLLRKATEVTVGRVKTAKYGDFARNLVVPTNLNVITMKPLRGQALLVVDPTLVFTVVDNMFGGDSRFHTRIEGRDFTATEQKVINRILDVMFESLASAWAPVHKVEFERTRSEMNTKFASVATQNEVVVYTTFTVEVGPSTSEFHICMPYAMIEPIRDLLTTSIQPETQGEMDSRWLKRMTKQMQLAEVELVAELGFGKVLLEDLMQIKPGDVLPITIGDTIEAKVDGVPVMECRHGIFNNQYSIRIEKLLRSDSSEYIKGEPHGD